ncbi:hypothetical protein SZN_26004 [Streptomyces zinciresistens K42]|uniref:Lipoprotein n=1 Tax=Streptomyces zinciresistens K42 TaxID=700597 RepID=G2GI61_9ACTN|nr:hypothetical protein SZN_26004 [Streptomyces zinciresistens K42]
MRGAATVTVGVLSFALVTGCGGGSGDAKGSKEPSASGTSGGQAAKALSAAELKKAIIAQGDVDGYKVDASGKQLPKSKDQIKSSDTKCLPLAYAMGGLAPGDATAATAVMATQEKKPSADASKSLEDLSEGEVADSLTAAMSLNMTVVGLSSYDGEGAARTFKSVSDGVRNCSGGFPLAMQGTDQKLTGITEEKSSGTGDESVAFTAVSKQGGDVATTHVEVVRQGGTIATYYTIDIGLMMTDKPYAVPADLVKAQAAKLK